MLLLHYNEKQPKVASANENLFLHLHHEHVNDQQFQAFAHVPEADTALALLQ
jgi:hypothetical protein